MRNVDGLIAVLVGMMIGALLVWGFHRILLLWGGCP